MNNVENFLSKLSKVKKSGRDSWRASCPSCGGKSGQKLSIKIGNTGAILVRCFAGCDVYSIVKSVGMDLTDLFPQKDSQGRSQRGAFRYEAIRELAPELNVAWVLLNDIASGRELSEEDRKRARVCAHRASNLLAELS